MDPGGEVTRVELGGGGGGRRRWWPLVAAGLAVWLVAAVALAGDDGDDDGEPAAAEDPATSTTTGTTATTVRRQRPPRTTTTVAGAPLLGRETGWQLVASTGAGSVRVLDLDTGEASELEADSVWAGRPDGIVFQTRVGGAAWAPVPLDDDSRVLLGNDAAWLAALPREGDVAWVGSTGSENRLRLVSLVDGADLATIEIPVTASVVGAIDRSLVVRAGAAAYVIGVDGDARRLADGYPLGMIDDRVAVQRCDEALRCSVVLVGLDGSERSVAWPEGWLLSNPVAGHDRWVLLNARDAGFYAVDAAGNVVELPPMTADLWASAWSPDGTLLFVSRPGGVDVLDPAAGGATVASIDWRPAGRTQLAVVGPPG